MRDFLAMGGYATWVWGAWSVATVVLLAMGVAAHRRLAVARERARRAAGAGR